MEWKTKFDDRVAVLESNISKLEREMSDTETKISSRKQFMTNYIWEISKLQTEANVILLASCCFSLGFCWLVFSGSYLLFSSFALGSYVLEEWQRHKNSKVFWKA